MFRFPVMGRLLLAANSPGQASSDSQAALELYDTSPTGNPGKLQCMFTLPDWEGGRTSVELYISNSYLYSPSTFFTRPEDRIATIFLEETSVRVQNRVRVTKIAVFVSTLLRLSESRNFIPWAEWKRYAWVAGSQEAYDSSHSGMFTSSSRFIYFTVPQKQPGVWTLEMTTFRPSLVERRLHIPGYTSDDPSDGEPCRLIGRKASLGVHVEDGDDPDVLMTEDNLILMTVRYLADDCFPVLTSRHVVGAGIQRGCRANNNDVLIALLRIAWTLRTRYWLVWSHSTIPICDDASPQAGHPPDGYPLPALPFHKFDIALYKTNRIHGD